MSEDVKASARTKGKRRLRLQDRLLQLAAELEEDDPALLDVVVRCATSGRLAKLERILQLDPEAFDRLERLIDEVLAKSEADWAASVAVAR